MQKKLIGKVVLIAGGSAGIGYAVAKLFLQQGASVVINGRRLGRLMQATNTLDPTGKHVAVCPGDISHHETGEWLVSLGMERFGGVDILVNSTETPWPMSVYEVLLPSNRWSEPPMSFDACHPIAREGNTEDVAQAIVISALSHQKK
jgi:NAD(P)-dependent dehydrogenase (short-subunit alcohol dehydrogenase family)